MDRNLHTATWPIFVLLLFAHGATAAAEDQTEADRKAEVRQLVLQLNSNLLAERDGAEQQLIELGADALPHLPEIRTTMPAELQQRLRRVRGTLEEQAAQRATQGSRVTLQGELTLSEALAKLTNQSGNRIVDYRNVLRQEATDPKLTLDLQDVPFWQALDVILDEADLALFPRAELDEAGIAIAEPMHAGAATKWIAYDGPFRMALIRLASLRDLTDSASNRMQATVQIICEPRLQPIMMTLPMDSISAETADGERLAAALGGVRPITIVTREVTIYIPLELPPRSAETLATFSGKFTALVPGKLEEFRFSDLPNDKALEQRKAGAIVALDQVRRNNDVWEVRIRVRFDDASGALDSHLLGWVLENPAFLEDAAGERLPHGALEKTREVADEFGVAYLFFPEKEIGDYTFVYETPAALINRDVTFSFEDVPLP
ncbi:MAG: hypothetical protein WD030_01125 [Pirellulales bacterium]